MATVPIYICKVVGDIEYHPDHIRSREHYVATLLMPDAVHGRGDTPEEAKADLQARMVRLHQHQGIVSVENDTLEI